MNSLPPRLRVTFPPIETRRDVLLGAAVQAEELGYDAFFVAEGWGLDAFALLAEIATRTERILIGSAIVNVWSRSAATLAMAAATLSEISGGRFVLGLGASTPQLVEGLHDVSYVSPTSQLRRVVTQVRALLGGGRVPLSAGNAARGLRLGVGPVSIPIYLAALAGASTRLTGEVADGWMPFFVPLSHLAARAELLDGSGVHPGTCHTWPIVGVAVADDPAEARARAAWWVAFYLTTMGPLYPRLLEDLGYGSEVAAVTAANPTRPATVVPAEAAVLLDELLVHGTPEAARQRLARWRTSGSSPILSLPPSRPADEIEFALRALAPEPD